jgi:hypothetical protein
METLYLILTYQVVFQSGDNCDSTSLNKPMSADEKALLYNPYNQNSAIDFLSKLSSDTEQVFGHTVIYFVTDPDKKDMTIHYMSIHYII